MTITGVAGPLRAEREMAFDVAATPSGPLAHAIDAYRQAVAVRVGTNAAHRSPPHCLLATYRDLPSSVDVYRHALAATVKAGADQRLVIVTALTTGNAWHGLEIEAPLLSAFATCFAARATTLRRSHRVTRQRRLRLVLAVDFQPADHEALSEFAHRIVDPALPAEWDIGLWRRDDDASDRLWQARVA
jgi:hypothetical protein